MLGMLLIKILCCLGGLFQLVSSELLFTSIKDLERILVVEKYLASDIKTYIQKEELRLAQLKRIADDFESHSVETLADPERHLSNPINAFLLVKRFTTDWNRILDDYIRSNASAELFGKVHDMGADFPGDEDLAGAATSLLRIQDTYSLTATEIARGDFQGVQNSPELTAEQCFELGRRAYANKDYYHSVLWLEEALKRTETEDPPTIPETKVLDYYAFSTASQGNLQHALNLTNTWLALEPNHERALKNKAHFEKIIEERQYAMDDEDEDYYDEEDEEVEDDDVADRDVVHNYRRLENFRAGSTFSRYEALCRGEKVMIIPEEHLLSCQYKSHHPLFYLSPLKEETLNFRPWIAVYHDVISERATEELQALAIPSFRTSTVFGEEPGIGTSDVRSSKNGWLTDDAGPVVNSFSEKAAAISNLTLDTAEAWQIANYGIGGHYEPHYDFSRDPELMFEVRIGNRILTTICYLSDVAAGGYTVFPNAGIKVEPVKGTCAVWYNLLANGEGDTDTMHAGCPVLAGSKWIANKWFHERGQEFRRRCDLHPNL